ncbi:MAG: TetR/AcrR family transcriptional regulator, partial [Nevskiales bacterium]
AITAQIEFAPKGSPARAMAQQLGLDTENIPDRTGSMALQILGMAKDEADEISRRPLPPLDPADEPF